MPSVHLITALLLIAVDHSINSYIKPIVHSSVCSDVPIVAIEPSSLEPLASSHLDLVALPSHFRIQTINPRQKVRSVSQENRLAIQPVDREHIRRQRRRQRRQVQRQNPIEDLANHPPRVLADLVVAVVRSHHVLQMRREDAEVLDDFRSPEWRPLRRGQRFALPEEFDGQHARGGYPER